MGTSSVQHILMKFLLLVTQKIGHYHFQIRILHGHISVEVRMESTFGDSSTIIAKLCSFSKPLRSAAQGAPDQLLSCIYCQWFTSAEKNTDLYNAFAKSVNNAKPCTYNGSKFNNCTKDDQGNLVPQFGGKKLRRRSKTSKKSHRKSSKKQRKSRRARKSRRGRR